MYNNGKINKQAHTHFLKGSFSKIISTYELTT